MCTNFNSSLVSFINSSIVNSQTNLINVTNLSSTNASFSNTYVTTLKSNNTYSNQVYLNDLAIPSNNPMQLFGYGNNIYLATSNSNSTGAIYFRNHLLRIPILLLFHKVVQILIPV